MNSSLIILALERPHLVSCSISQCSPKRQNPSACVYVCGGGGFVSKSCLTLGTPWTVAHRLLCPWDFPGRNTGVGYHFLLQKIFPAVGSNPYLLKWQVDSFTTHTHTHTCVKVKSLSCVQFIATPWTVAYQAPPSMGFSRQEYWSGLAFPSPEDLPDLGIEPRSPALWVDALLYEPPGKFPLLNIKWG